MRGAQRGKLFCETAQNRNDLSGTVFFDRHRVERRSILFNPIQTVVGHKQNTPQRLPL
jgi:hypothetical protein